MNVRSFVAACILSAVIVPASFASRDSYLGKVGVDQRLDQPLPLSAPFRDEGGREVRLKDYFTDKPVLLTFVYYRCPMVCPIGVKYLAESLKRARVRPGTDLNVLIMSFDPLDTPERASLQKEAFLDNLGDATANGGVHFLTGTEDAIREVTQAAGFRYIKNKDNGLYTHPVLVLVATPEGRVSRYFFEFGPPTKDIRLALIDAGERKIGAVARAVLHYCFYFDPANGRYSLAVINLLKFAAAVTVITIIALITLLRKQDKKRGW